jgi:hypothetical protein
VPFVSVNKAKPLPAAKPSAAMSRALGEAVHLAARRGRNLWPIETIERMLMHRNAMPLVTDARWRTIEHELLASIEEALRTQVGVAGTAELNRIDNAVQKVLTGRFDLRNPFSEDFVRRRSGELIRGITGAARDYIRDAVEAGLVNGVPVRTTARVIQAGIGLDPRLQRALARHGEELSAQGADDETITDSLERYADQLLSYRSEMIARTETMTASNQGTLDSWRQANNDGLLPGGMMKRWIAAVGSLRTCPICNELADHDPVPAIGGVFTSGILGDSFEAPPAHPNCRCTVGLVRP